MCMYINKKETMKAEMKKESKKPEMKKESKAKKPAAKKGKSSKKC